MRRLFLALQIAAWVLWQPFNLVAWLTNQLAVKAAHLGHVLVRPLYWSAVVAKRRVGGEPLWQPQDWQLGIGPPCETCGRFVVGLDKHAEGCPEKNVVDIARQILRDRQRQTSLRTYLMALRAGGVDVGDKNVKLGNIVTGLLDDVGRAAEEFKLDVPWEDARTDLHRIADDLASHDHANTP